MKELIFLAMALTAIAYPFVDIAIYKLRVYPQTPCIECVQSRPAPWSNL